MTRPSFTEALASRPWLLADGATGTNYFQMGLESGDAPEMWNFEHPDRVRSLHRRFIEAGADIVFVESLQSDDEMRRACAAIDKPLIANMSDGGKTPIRAAKQLAELGYSLAIFPAMAALAASAAMEAAMRNLKTSGTSVSPEVPLFSFDEFCGLVGFEDVWAFEEKWREVLQK